MKKRDKKIIMWAVIIALILHLIIFVSNFLEIPWFKLSPEEQKKRDNLAEQLRKHKNKDMGALKPQSTAPVKFQSLPEEEPEPPKPQEQLKPEPKQQINQQPPQPKKIEQKKESQLPKQETPKKIKSTPTKKVIENKLAKPVPEKNKGQNEGEIKKLENIKEPEKIEKIEDNKNIKLPPPKETQEAPEPQSGPRIPKMVERNYADRPKMPANIIHGFFKFMEEEGNNKYLYRAGSNFSYDPRDAKYLSYINKIIEFFHGANNPNDIDWLRDAIMYGRAKKMDKIQTGYELTIGPQGHLENIKIIDTSGFPAYDRKNLEQFKRAAPFPPIPKHFKKDKFKFRIGIFIPI